MSEIDMYNSGDEAEDEEENIEMTAAEVLEKLEEAWLNEKFSPDLLESKTDLVECMLEQVHAMEENLRLARKGDLKISLHRMEIDRVRFVISSYLRLRLSKIEKFTSYSFEKEEKRGENQAPLLSEAEEEFAKRYLESIKGHFNTLALRHMPPIMQSMEKELAGVKPNLDSYVFLRVNQSTQNVLIDDDNIDAGDEIIDLEKGDQHILRYKPVASLVASGAVSLI
ncbi:hypothetical protein C0Q70_08743 [Pomacea canaliculata]|uniref:DNA replication complex GINS protein SLD5 n=2 Tax=Pomacea canaliculata TaxID=400727 RepID=A0A2T7P7U2_POMCA|nr:hypothetical protein C0Q70_08743 [Pomacea canaliculata]